jgi:hypothetical protein
MADYQYEFKRILDEEIGDYAARALGLLTQAIQVKGLVLTEEVLHSLRKQVVAAALTTWPVWACSSSSTGASRT